MSKVRLYIDPNPEASLWVTISHIGQLGNNQFPTWHAISVYTIFDFTPWSGGSYPVKDHKTGILLSKLFVDNPSLTADCCKECKPNGGYWRLVPRYNIIRGQNRIKAPPCILWDVSSGVWPDWPPGRPP